MLIYEKNYNFFPGEAGEQASFRYNARTLLSSFYFRSLFVNINIGSSSYSLYSFVYNRN